MADIKNINELLKINIDIPNYQRPYKWTIQNIKDLLADISTAMSSVKKYGASFKYRIGTIIIHENKNKFDVVDGQQRIVSLLLIKQCIEPSFRSSIFNKQFTNKITQANIRNNYLFIKEWFSLKDDEYKKRFNDAFEEILEVVVVSVDKVSEAFQLFDSQNTRGKALDPHDLLKAYHLREMKKCSYDEMKSVVFNWEKKDTSHIRELFDLYLFHILNWSRGVKSKAFTAKEIDTYKGITEDSEYPYAKRARKASSSFQITESFIAGKDFFEMVEHYMELLQKVKDEICENLGFEKIKNIICESKESSVGFAHARNLFYCALLYYYDKFGNFDEMVVKKLFTWAFMLRVDLENLGFDSINKYAIGDGKNSRYTNAVAMFSKISFARLHDEIVGLQIKVDREDRETENEKWNELHKAIKKINGGNK